MINFKEETLDALKQNNKTIDEIEYIVYGNKYMEIADFFNQIDFEYDNGYGGAEIQNLFIVGKDWWLERGEYDGSEWWEFKTKPIKPDKKMFNFKSNEMWED